MFRKLFVKFNSSYEDTFQIERYTQFDIGRVIRLKIDVKTLKIRWFEIHNRVSYNTFRDVKNYDSTDKHVFDMLLKNEYIYQ